MTELTWIPVFTGMTDSDRYLSSKSLELSFRHSHTAGRKCSTDFRDAAQVILNNRLALPKRIAFFSAWVQSRASTFAAAFQSPNS